MQLAKDELRLLPNLSEIPLVWILAFHSQLQNPTNIILPPFIWLQYSITIAPKEKHTVCLGTCSATGANNNQCIKNYMKFIVSDCPLDFPMHFIASQKLIIAEQRDKQEKELSVLTDRPPE